MCSTALFCVHKIEIRKRINKTYDDDHLKNYKIKVKNKKKKYRHGKENENLF